MRRALLALLLTGLTAALLVAPGAVRALPPITEVDVAICGPQVAAAVQADSALKAAKAKKAATKKASTKAKQKLKAADKKLKKAKQSGSKKAIAKAKQKRSKAKAKKKSAAKAATKAAAKVAPAQAARNQADAAVVACGVAARQTTRISDAPDGAEADGVSYVAVISDGGRYVAYDSEATNLVADDTNDLPDVFVKDRRTGVTERISVSTSGVEANGSSTDPTISADGRYVAFNSEATNLVADDENNSWDIFVHDRQTGATTLVSLANNGDQGDGDSLAPSITADGSFIAYQSDASNLADNDTNNASDVFVSDWQTGVTFTISTGDNGELGTLSSFHPQISADGMWIAFASYNALLPADTNVAGDVYARSMAGELELVSVSSAEVLGNGESQSPSINADGSVIAFQSDADNLVADDLNTETDIFVRDRQAGTTSRVSVTSANGELNGGSTLPWVSADGTRVSFQSFATDLAPIDDNSSQDAFLHDIPTGNTVLLSGTADVTANGTTYVPRVSPDGQFVGFTSQADDLVQPDTNGEEIFDVFVAFVGDLN